MKFFQKIFISSFALSGLLFGSVTLANTDYEFRRPPAMSLSYLVMMQDALEKAELGDMDMQYKVANIYYNGEYLGEEVTKDRKKAFEFYQKAANQGHAKSQTKLAIMYQEGEVIRQNIDEHIKWLKKAASQNEPNAQVFLGIAYEYGVDVPQNEEVAKEWYGKACDSGDLFGCKHYKKMNELSRTYTRLHERQQ